MTKAHGPKLFVYPTFPKDQKEIIIRPVSDVHYGNPHFNQKIVDELIYELKHEPNMYWVNVGDMTENNTKDQPHDGVNEQTMNPEQQLDAYINDFTPVVDKLLVAIEGNHDLRTKNKSSIDLMRRASREMNYPDRYVGDGAFLVLRLGQRTESTTRRADSRRPCTYTVFVTHGSSSGAAVSSKASGLEKMSDVCNAHVYIGGHTHSQIIFRDRFYYYDENSKAQLSYMDRWYINGGSALDYGGYALTARYAPQPPGFPYIKLSGIKEEISATLK